MSWIACRSSRRKNGNETPQRETNSPRGFPRKTALTPFPEQHVPQKPSRYQSALKRVAPSNPIIFGARPALWVFWSMIAILTVMIIGATFWLLMHPLTA
jgi:hypothetical protein